MSKNINELLDQLSSSISPQKYYAARRRGKKLKTKRQLKYWTYDPVELPLHNEMSKEKIFIGASDYSDYVFSQLMMNREERELSTFNRELKLHGNRKDWFEFIEEEFDGDTILEVNDSYGIVVTENVNFIRYDVNSNSINVRIYGDKEFVDELPEIFLKKFELVKSYIEWVYSSDGNSVNVPLNTDRLPVQEMYPFLGEESLGDYYERFLKSSANILLLIGPPGTGKTTFIRGLLAHSSTSAIVTYDSAILEKDYLFARFIEDETGVMVLEDSDNFLKARSDGNTMMHRFLNVGDGLVTTKGKKLIFSTNLPSIRDVDPALVRPGRCFDILNFDTLKQAEAEKLANKLGVRLEGKKDRWTIAEVFNKQIETENNKKVGSKMGFI